MSINKRFVLLFCFTFLLSGCIVTTEKKEKIIIDTEELYALKNNDFSIDIQGYSIYLGKNTTLDELNSALSETAISEERGQNIDLHYEKFGLTVTLHTESDGSQVIMEFSLFTNFIETSRNVKVGDYITRLSIEYGDTTSYEQPSDCFCSKWYYEKGNDMITFTIDNKNYVEKIQFTRFSEE